jgi:hypothetical protein
LLGMSGSAPSLSSSATMLSFLCSIARCSGVNPI